MGPSLRVAKQTGFPFPPTVNLGYIVVPKSCIGTHIEKLLNSDFLWRSNFCLRHCLDGTGCVKFGQLIRMCENAVQWPETASPHVTNINGEMPIVRTEMEYNNCGQWYPVAFESPGSFTVIFETLSPLVVE